MCALTSFPITNWPLLNHNIGYGQKCINYEGNESIDSIFLRFPPQDEEVLLDHRSPSFTAQTSSCVDPGVVKKLNHNASERDRRKKVNHLYSSLRSLLPASAQMKKLSFPETVSHALKYIPELQQQVEVLVQKKEKLLLRISQQRKSTITRSRGPTPSTASSSAAAAVSINRSSERDVSIQISMHKTQNNLLSEILQFFEQDGSLQLLNANCFETSGGMLFYNIHLQMENTHKLESEALSDKLLSLFDNREDLLINY